MGTPITAAAWIAGGKRFTSAAGGIFYRREPGTGLPVVMLHGFPTWSYDYAELAAELAPAHEVITLDFLGYGASDKPRDHVFTVGESADTVEALLAALGIERAHLVIHDYGGIVGQELLDRRRKKKLSFEVASVHLMNCGVVYELYRPTRMQRLLANRLLGRFIASRVTKKRLFTLLNAVRGPTHHLTNAQFDELFYGIALENGHTLAHRHIHYNAERAVHHRRWLEALETYDGPLQLIWGLADPVSGAHVLDVLRPKVPRARVDTFADVGHFPMSEAPAKVAAAIKEAIA